MYILEKYMDNILMQATLEKRLALAKSVATDSGLLRDMKLFLFLGDILLELEWVLKFSNLFMGCIESSHS